MSRLADVIAALEARYDPSLAEPWDAVGLVCGDPDAPVRRVLFAIDPVATTVDEAIEIGADLLVTHHPLFLTGVHGIPASDPKGRLVHRLISAGCGLFVAHTNADRAQPGVNDALAAAVGLAASEPLQSAAGTPTDALVTFVPRDAAARVLDALSDAGAGAIGNYARAAFLNDGIGTFTPLAGAAPTIGVVGRVEEVSETRIEMVLSRSHRDAVVRALRASHPYEQPAYTVVELANPRGAGQGLGRVGPLDRPMSLGDFATRVASALPETASGVRFAGDPGQEIRTVAVCGGSGGSLIDTARSAGADVFLTSDLRHHPVSESAESSDLTLLDAAHWATEWPWLPAAARLLGEDLGDASIDVRVSSRRTDPWTAAVQSIPGITPSRPQV